MKKQILTVSILMILVFSNYAQTNRINHYSHSGKSTTINIFKANDNMGLGCGSSFATEYTPDTTKKNVMDSIRKDSLKTKVCIPIPTSEKPRKGMSLQPLYNVENALGKFKK